MSRHTFFRHLQNRIKNYVIGQAPRARGEMGECENLANLKLTIKEIQRKLVEGCECAAKSFKSEYSGFSAEQCLLLGVGAMFFGALLGIQGFAFYKRAVTGF